MNERSVEEFFAHFLIAACLDQQERLICIQAAGIEQFGYAWALPTASDFEQYSKNRYVDIKEAVGTLYSFYDDMIMNLMIHYGFDCYDATDVEQVAKDFGGCSVFLRKGHPVISILKTEKDAFEPDPTYTLKPFQSIH